MKFIQIENLKTVSNDSLNIYLARVKLIILNQKKTKENETKVIQK